MVVRRLLKQLGSDITGGLDLLSAGFSHPILTLRDPLGAVERTREEGATKTISRTLRTTALTAGALLLPTRAGLSFAGKQILARPAIVPIGLIAGGAAVISPKIRRGIDIGTDPSTFIAGGEILGGVVETGKAPDISVGEAAIAGGIVGAGAVIIPKIVERFRDKKEAPTELERQQVDPTLSPILPEIPTPIGAAELPDAVEKAGQPINIDIDVKPEINVKPRKSEILINNIMQNI